MTRATKLRKWRGMRHVFGLIGWLVVLVALAAGGCATAPPVEANGLALRRVVVYRNGVGYFERAGRVDGSEVRFRVRKNEIGDFLATLAVLERGGSSVRSASFPLAVEDDDTPPPPPSPPAKSGPAAPGARTSDLETVVMGLDGKEHDLQVGYIAATPIWRPSYRLVLGKDGATLQVWGIVENLSGEDWKNVSLSLIAEAPLAFQAELAAPVIPPRPSVTDNGEVIAVVPRSETSLAQGEDQAPPPPALAAPEEAGPGMSAPMPAPTPSGRPSRKTRGYGGGGAGEMAGASRGTRGFGSAATAPAPDYSRRARNLSALAAIALQAGATRYDLPAAVTIPDKSATMVMLLDRPIPGEAISLYAPDGGVPESASHPFRVARFTNKTGGLLERGPLAIFEEGAFLGQGMTDPLPEGAAATVPFALERTLAVEKEYESREEGARLYKIEAGVLSIARDSVTLTKYKLRNGADRVAKLLIKHPRTATARLVHPPAGTEDNLGTGSALVPTELGARASKTVTVDERVQSVRNADWLSPLAEEAVGAYVADRQADPAVVKTLAGAWVIRKVLVAAANERAKLAAEESDLRRATEETRQNIKALEKNKAADDLRAKLTSRLEADSARLDQITKRTVEVDLAINEQRVRFQDAIRGIKVVNNTTVTD
jgi:hypothetical protein